MTNFFRDPQAVNERRRSTEILSERHPSTPSVSCPGCHRRRTLFPAIRLRSGSCGGDPFSYRSLRPTRQAAIAAAANVYTLSRCSDISPDAPQDFSSKRIEYRIRRDIREMACSQTTMCEGPAVLALTCISRTCLSKDNIAQEGTGNAAFRSSAGGYLLIGHRIDRRRGHLCPGQ